MPGKWDRNSAGPSGNARLGAVFAGLAFVQIREIRVKEFRNDFVIGLRVCCLDLAAANARLSA